MKKNTFFFLMALLWCAATVAQTTRYVKAGGAGAANGLSWANASGDLQATIDASAEGDEVWVAVGSYQRAPTQYFSMKKGVKIYGGFPSTGTPGMVDRIAPTATSGSILKGNGNMTILNYRTYLTITSSLDGFTITEGNNTNITGSAGGGMRNEYTSPAIANCIFVANYAKNFGGGMYNLNSNPLIINCLFVGNKSLKASGIGNESSNPTIINCTIAGNTSEGMISQDFSKPKLYNCIVIGNQGGAFDETATSVK